MTLTGKPQALSFFSYGALMSHFLPSIPTGNTEFFMTNVEQPSLFECDGKIGVGHTERSYYRGDAERVFEPKLLRELYVR
jgi:hypothetical protein